MSGPGNAAPDDHEPRAEAPVARSVSALPSRGARFVAFASIVVAGLCGAVIGWAVADLQCEGDCAVVNGVSAIGAGAAAAIGVAVIAVLALRAMSEWSQGGLRLD